MSTTLRLSLGVSAWSMALLGALSISRLPGNWGHAICGPWGCGPTIQSLVACHLAWLVALGPAAAILSRTSGLSAALRWVGIALIFGAIFGLLAVVLYQRATWWPLAAEWQQSYFWHRCGFVIATSVDLPLIQTLFVGTALMFMGGRTQRLS